MAAYRAERQAAAAPAEPKARRRPSKLIRERLTKACGGPAPPPEACSVCKNLFHPVPTPLSVLSRRRKWECAECSEELRQQMRKRFPEWKAW